MHTPRHLLCVAATLLFAPIATPAAIMEVTNVWRYNASGADLGTAWRAVDYDDQSWPSGRGILAFEDSSAVRPINTVLPLQGTNGAVTITFYFRTTFVYTNALPELPMFLIASNLIDDGAVFFLNGQEVGRVRMPSGLVTSQTLATGTGTEGAYDVFAFPLGALLAGTNFIAVEVHQNSPGSSDIAFGMALMIRDGISPQVTQNPTNTTAPIGTLIQASGAVSGDVPFSYQWWKDGVAIAGATNSTLLLYRATHLDEGTYWFTVTNGAGGATSTVATATVTEPRVGTGARNTSFQGEVFGFVHSVETMADGSFLVAGTFPSGINSIPAWGVARLDAFGNVDAMFNAGFPAELEPVPHQGYITLVYSNRIYIGGLFQAGGRTNLARLHLDGTLDTEFIPPAPNGRVRAFAPQPDGKVVVAGEFTLMGGVERMRIARLHPNGTLDTSFAAGPAANNVIRALLLLPDGKILVGGSFSQFDGVAQSGLARLHADGSRDASFLLSGNVAPRGVYVLAESGEQIWVGGDFVTFDGMPAGRLTRIDRDGVVDSLFQVGAGFAGGQVYTVTEDYNGRLIVGGIFTQYNGNTANRIVRLWPDGSRDLEFNTGTAANGQVLATALAPNGDIVAAGLFSSFDGVVANQMVMLFGDGGPSLDVRREVDRVVVSFPHTARRFRLQQSTNLTGSWIDINDVLPARGGRYWFTNSIATSPLFFRLAGF